MSVRVERGKTAALANGIDQAPTATSRCIVFFVQVRLERYVAL